MTNNSFNSGGPPLIFAIKSGSFDDGPGIRTVVFFKGCPLSCLWCHNPEGRYPGPEIAYDSEPCAACGHCLSVCPRDALNRDHRYFIDRAKCNLCFECTEACPSGALRRVGRTSTVEDIVRRVARDKPFFDTSGGGVTLSGGEPTLFMDFTAQLLVALKAQGIHTLLETCGRFDLETFRRKISPWVDCIYFDLKLFDPGLHRRFCGCDNREILNNFKKLWEKAEAGGWIIVPRLPLIPGITDTVDNLSAAAGFLKTCGADYLQLLPYHPLWRKKTRMMGLETGQDSRAGLDRLLPSENMKAARALFGRAGIRT